MKIYMLMAVHDYDGPEMITAFKHEADADAICDAGNKHLEAEPKYRWGMTADEEIAFQFCMDEWNKANPVGTDHYSGDSYQVKEIELIESLPTTQSDGG